jgi:hypothetical protein
MLFLSGEFFFLDHKCASKGFFLVELGEEDNVEAVADKLGVSLHALTGLCTTNMMHLIIYVKGKQPRALVDSSSTHSFIHEAVVHALGLDVMHRPGLSIKVASAERLQTMVFAKILWWTLKGRTL